MILDYSSAVNAEGVVVFPDFPFGTLPTDPDDIGETVVLKGTAGGVSPSVTGTADQAE